MGTVCILFERFHACQECGLYHNQKPLLDNKFKSNVIWVGLSSVDNRSSNNFLPLDPKTKSGSLIAKIEEPNLNEFSFYKTNLVKCLPLTGDKIRYPFQLEMEKCYPYLEEEVSKLDPKIVFLLGKQVSNFVLSKEKIASSLNEHFKYESHTIGNRSFIPIHHPSFMLIYRRKHLPSYIDNLDKLIKLHAS